MKCPSCGEKGAYVGALFIECPDEECKFYSERQHNERLEESLREMEKQLDECFSDPDKTPTYHYGIPVSD